MSYFFTRLPKKYPSFLGQIEVPTKRRRLTHTVLEIANVWLIYRVDVPGCLDTASLLPCWMCVCKEIWIWSLTNHWDDKTSEQRFTLFLLAAASFPSNAQLKVDYIYISWAFANKFELASRLPEVLSPMDRYLHLSKVHLFIFYIYPTLISERTWRGNTDFEK